MELMLFGVEGFVIAATCNDDTTVIHTCTYLEGSLLKLQSLAIQEKCRIVRGTNGFIVCSFGVDGSIRVRTSTSLRSWPVANYKWIMQHESRVYRAALLHSDSDGFIIASGGEDGTKVQTRARLEDPLLKNHPWKMSNIDDTPFYYDVALLNSTMDGFVVASLDNYGVKIQTRRRFEDSLLESITGDIRLSTSHDYYHIALMHHENDGFSVAIERSKEKSATQTHVYHLLPAGQVKNKYFSILSTKAKVFRCFQSLSNALFRNGFSGLLYKNNNVKQQHNYSSSLEVDEPLAYYVDDFLLSSHYEEYRHTIKTTPENTSCVIEHNATSRDISALRSDTDGYIVASAGPDGSTQINKLKRLESSILKNGLFSIQHKHHIIKRSFIKLMDGASFLSVIDASYQFYLFDFNEESNRTLLISQKIPHCISYAQFWRDEKIHFYVAYQIPEGVAITEYQLQNV